MCDLLGMSFNVELQPTFSFKNFSYKDRRNPSGWGVAYYMDKSAQILKEPYKASESLLVDTIARHSHFSSRIFLFHVRAASKGGVSRRNTHPFSRELFGKEYVFAHNGTLSRTQLGKKWSKRLYQPIGETDSEMAFCYVLSHIKKKEITKWNADHFSWLESKLQSVNAHGVFNALFSDSSLLFAYSDKEGHNGFSYVKRSEEVLKPIELLHLPDSKNSYITINDGNADTNIEGYVVSTTQRTGKPTDEEWTPLQKGKLTVFESGKIIYGDE